jgi:hypothetical protein
MRRTVNFPPSSTLFLGEATSSRVCVSVIAASPRLPVGRWLLGSFESLRPMLNRILPIRNTPVRRLTAETPISDPPEPMETQQGRGVLNPAPMSAEVWAVRMVRHCALILEETARTPDLTQRVSSTARYRYGQTEIVSGRTKGK